MAAPVLFFIRTFPSDLHGHVGQDASIVAGECDGKVSSNQIRTVESMNDSRPEREIWVYIMVA